MKGRHYLSAVVAALFLCASPCAGAQDPAQPGSQQASLEQLTVQYMKLFQDENYTEASALAQLAVTTAEKQVGAEHPAVAQTLNDLGLIYGRLGQDEKAIATHQRALAIRRRLFEPDGPEVAQSLGNLAKAYQAARQFAQAEPLYAELLTILRKHYLPDNSRLLDILGRYADCLRENGKNEQAEAVDVEIRVGKAGSPAALQENLDGVPAQKH